MYVIFVQRCPAIPGRMEWVEGRPELGFIASKKYKTLKEAQAVFPQLQTYYAQAAMGCPLFIRKEKNVKASKSRDRARRRRRRSHC